MALSEPLIDNIKKGKIILFLGSGALYGADLPGKKIPLGNDLRDILCEQSSQTVETRKISKAELKFRDAFERLKAGKPDILPKGTPSVRTMSPKKPA